VRAPAPPDGDAVLNPPPPWQRAWMDRIPALFGLGLLLTALTVVLFLQDVIVRYPAIYRPLRIAFLTVTLVWLGWIAGAQLSVVNVLTFVQALLTGFHWEDFLLEPLIFVLWAFVAITMLFWGRGVFCGWLCPFGALQELLNRIAVALRVPQIRLPFGLHERLWPLKYIIFLALFAVSLGSMVFAFVGAEVEPFKTAITLHFMRAWPFVAYAAALLVAGLFIERFFCRYLCPLGAALAIPARLRMFDWLKRKHQCGSPCQNCAVTCMVQAIHPDGRINPNECVHCLECQVLYYDEFTCPPLIERRKRRERREAMASGSMLDKPASTVAP
jgi:polyferredoxin